MDKVELTQTERDLLRSISQRTGALGGRKAASQMTPEQRSERARKAAAARWTKTA